jgi:secondary thiamine-phosphate synthase enzyme
MQIYSTSIDLSTRGHTDILDLTPALKEKIDSSGLHTGTATLFISGSTAGLTTIEYEPGLLRDLPEMFEKLAPENADYHHHETWGDRNGSAHVRAALVGPSLVVPFTGGRLDLGTWQQVVLMDFDDRPRRRSVLCRLMGQ